MERAAGCFWAAPVSIVHPLQLAHDIGDGNKFAARQRICAGNFDGMPNNREVDHTINIYRVDLQVRFTVIPDSEPVAIGI